MAFLFVDSLPQNYNRVFQTSIKALELLLLSAGLISTLVMVKGAVVPYSCEIVFSSLVGFWNSIKCFLSSPLYICIIINFMVVLIAASSAFHNHKTDNQDDEIKVNVDNHDMQIAESPVVSPPPPAAPPPSRPRDVAKVTPPSSPRNVTKVAAASLSSRTKTSSRSTTSSTLYQGSNNDDSPHVWPNRTEQSCSEKATLSSAAALFFNENLMLEAHEIKKTTYSLNSSPDLSESIEEKKKVTTNLPALPRKGKEVFKEKEDEVTSNLSDDKENEEEDTMEATWKAITGGGKQRPKKEQLKKSETWDVPPRNTVAVQRLDSEELLPSTPKWKELRKSETFNDAVSITCRGGLRRDPSMSLDEFNKQVEAFIKKFNDNMKLQRQESDQRFLDMIKRGL
ncbi:hypothetical protein Pfo_010972 [Paulownia fortunei]|nr:hypothetical protein Pfo_010972 [Paulownia fortunei]